MSMSVVDLIESAAGGDGHNHKEDVNAKKIAGKKGDPSRSSEVIELEIEKGKGSNSSTGGDSGLIESGVGRQDEEPEKIDSAKKENPRDNDGTILNATAQLILQKLEKASEERNTISGFVEK